jgi:hypothetical protein
MKERKTPDEVWDGLFRDICTNADGSLNLDQIKKELSDFHFLMQEIPKVYIHITGGILSKIMYESGTVIGLADEHYQSLAEESEAQNEPLFRIWSHERAMYWRPHSNGYAESRDDAGLYSLPEAIRICELANRYSGIKVHESMIPVVEEVEK